LIVAIVEVVRFGFDYAGGNSRAHNDATVDAKLDRFHRVFRGLRSTKDATHNPLMVENLAFGHGPQTSLKIRERTETL